MGCIMSDLLKPSKYLTGKIQYGLEAGKPELIIEWKRAWMLLMFLRRDMNLVKDLF